MRGQSKTGVNLHLPMVELVEEREDSCRMLEKWGDWVDPGIDHGEGYLYEQEHEHSLQDLVPRWRHRMVLYVRPGCESR